MAFVLVTGACPRKKEKWEKKKERFCRLRKRAAVREEEEDLARRESGYHRSHIVAVHNAIVSDRLNTRLNTSTSNPVPCREGTVTTTAATTSMALLCLAENERPAEECHCQATRAAVD